MDKKRSEIEAARVDLEETRLLHDTKVAEREVKLTVYLELLDAVAKAHRQAEDQAEARRNAGRTSSNIYELAPTSIMTTTTRLLGVCGCSFEIQTAIG